LGKDARYSTTTEPKKFFKIFVFAGKIRVIIDKETIILNAFDTIEVKPETSFTIMNISSSDSSVYVMYYTKVD
jgi:glyoxylate utilization-related uncharacterized protein